MMYMNSVGNKIRGRFHFLGILTMSDFVNQWEYIPDHKDQLYSEFTIEHLLVFELVRRDRQRKSVK